jgi:hypothetical protein
VQRGVSELTERADPGQRAGELVREAGVESTLDGLSGGRGGIVLLAQGGAVVAR